MNFYTNNTLIALTTSVATAAGAPINATTMVFRITTPDGVIADYSGTVTNPTVGQYVADFLAVQVGLHQYEWVATGAAQVAAVGQFVVNQSTF